MRVKTATQFVKSQLPENRKEITVCEQKLIQTL